MEVFDLTEEQATSISGFEVNPVKSENDILESCNDLVLSIDTHTVLSDSFDKFKKAFTIFDYKNHEIHVEATG